jgi:hypothetical protein
MKKILSALLLLTAPAMFCSAGPIKLDFQGNSYNGDNPAVPAVSIKAAAVAPAKAAPKKWTVMVFLNAKNNLELAGLYNVNQMEKVGSDANVNIVAELGRMNGQAAGDTHLDGDWTGAQRIYVTRDADENVIKSQVVDKLAKEDMGDYKRVVNFVQWAKKNYPAQRYMLILWDHGSGWMDPQQTANANKGISFDDETNNYIRTKQIGAILKEAGGVDVLAFDACLMQMGEVAFEVKDNTRVIIGSEETVPGLGYPYAAFLGSLAKNPNMTNADLGRVTVAAYKAFYNGMPNQDGSKKPVQLSAINSDKLNELGALVKDFAAAAKGAAQPEAFKAARAGVIRYDMIGAGSDPAMTISFYGDLHQYVGLLAAGVKGDAPASRSADIKAKAAAIQTFIDKQLVIANAAIGKNRAGHEMTESRGISVYLPPAEARIAQEKLEGIFEGKYTDFVFDGATGWHDYVTFLYGVK